MPTQLQYDTTLQPIRKIECRIAVLDLDYNILDEISGRVNSIKLNIDAESDIRRTADISMVLKGDVLDTNSNSFYWRVGNPYWFDKYLQIYVAIQDIQTDEFVWVNEGVYRINSPTISYNATTNDLSFQAVDLMSQLTGMRDGYLEGMTYTVPAGSKITGAIEGILIEQGISRYILLDPPQKTTPQDINIDIGGTAYDLLCQLRDINSNWEMFFDVDGVFHFQQIPSGKVVTDPTTGELGEPIPLVDHVIWDKTNVSYTLDTNFEEVKNCVEVLGKLHEPDEFGTSVIDGDTITITTTKVINNYLNNSWVIGFGVTAGSPTDPPVAIATPITSIVLNDLGNNTIASIDISDTPITNGNEYYCIKLVVGATASEVSATYLGFVQPHAIAIENNPESPFYVGTATEYTSQTGNVVDFVQENEDFITIVYPNVTGNSMSVNLSPWCTRSIFDSVPVGYSWQFRMAVNVTQPIISMVVIIAGSTNTYNVRNLAGQNISLDYSQNYMLIAEKTSNTALTLSVAYYPMPASNFPMSTTSYLDFPKFRNQVRYVCAGDEYDNIYSNDLAEQRARYEIYLRSRLHDSINITTVPIYWLDVNNIIEYNLPNGNGQSDLWLVKSINTDISKEGTQSINAIRYYPLYADITLPNLATQE